MLYHREVYWPIQIERISPKGNIPLIYTRHAEYAAKTDRYGKITLPDFLNCDKSLCFECEINNEEKKFVYRTHYDAKYDLVIVIMKSKVVGWVVKTVWLNLKSDNHKTLAKKNYATA